MRKGQPQKTVPQSQNYPLKAPECSSFDPLEDEYIQNLKQQIRFLGLEVKALRKKEAQQPETEGEGSTQPMQQLLETKEKFFSMEKAAAEKIAEAQKALLLLEEENAGFKALADYFENALITKQQLALEKQNYFHAEEAELNLAAQKAHQAAVEINNQLEKAQAAFEKADAENTELVASSIKDLVTKEREKQLRENVERTRELRWKAATALKEEAEKELQNLQTSEKIVQIEERIQAQKKLLAEREKALGEALFEADLAEQQIKASIEWREKETAEKTKLLAEVDSLRVQLSEAVKNSAARVNRKLRDNESLAVVQMQREVEKEQQKLKEVDTQLSMLQDAYHTLSLDVKLQQDGLSRLQAHKTAINVTLQELREKIEVVWAPEHRLAIKESGQLEIEVDELFSSNQRLEQEEKKEREKHIRLNASVEFLRQNFDFEKVLKQVDLEGLRKMLQANQSVNKTVTQLLEKWDGLKK